MSSLLSLAWRLGLPLWLAIMLLLAIFVAFFAVQYLTVAPEDYFFAQQVETFTRMRTALHIHALFSSIALVAGALQFIAYLRRQLPTFHRFLGIVYMGVILPAALSGLALAPSAYGGASNTVAFSLLGSLWLVATFLGFWMILRGDIQHHRRWMLRSYALTFAAVTLRVELPLFQLAGLSFDEAYLIVPWTCWVLNLFVAEWIILERGADRTAAPGFLPLDSSATWRQGG